MILSIGMTSDMLKFVERHCAFNGFLAHADAQDAKTTNALADSMILGHKMMSKMPRSGRRHTLLNNSYDNKMVSDMLALVERPSYSPVFLAQAGV